MLMPFGRHRGVPLDQLPTGYLAWLAQLDDLRDPLRRAVIAECARRATRRDAAGEDGARARVPMSLRAPALDIIAMGFRAAAKRAHPDGGGEHGRMVVLIEARDALRALVGAA
jgi:hypothetical protein